jgi:hypothetical protein
MKKFKGSKPVDQIKREAKEQGWKVDMRDFNKGGDWFWLRDMNNRATQVCVNSCNGHFEIYKPSSERPIATHLSQELDGTDWYDEILNLLYIPVEQQ